MTRTHCPHCGAALPVRALACPDCGSDQETGWASEETQHEAAWADSGEESYQDVIRSLPGSHSGATARPTARDVVLALIALIALVGFILTFVF